MKRVLFFVENGWAFGSLHHGLCKELFKKNIYCNVLDWSQDYTLEDFRLLNELYDTFVTIPNMAYLLLNKNIPAEKIIIVAHEQTDLYYTSQVFGVDFFDQFKKFGGISPIIRDTSKKIGITKEMTLVTNGVHFNNFYRPVKDNLKVVGYGGAKHSSNYFGVDRKRGHLVEMIVEGVDNISFLNHKFYNYLCMPSYYEQIDCLIVSSLEDAGGLPALEAAASGVLVMSTSVGYFEKHGPKGGGIVLPMDEVNFVEQGIVFLEYFRDNSKAYTEKCREIQEYAKNNYDWSVVIDTWVNLLT